MVSDRVRVGGLHEDLDRNSRLPYFKRTYVVGDVPTPVRQCLLVAVL